MQLCFQKKPLTNNQFYKNSFIFVLLVSGSFGFLSGVLYATPQYIIEAAQITAGVVTYPQPTIWSLLISRLWTLPSQICAIFLVLGGSELVLSHLVSGLLGMLSFQAVSLITLALSNNSLLSIATPFFILMTNAYDFGIHYSIAFVAPSTYGVLGLSFTLLVIAVISNRRYKLGAFLLGLAPAIQCVLGLSLWLIVVTSFLCDIKSLRSHFSKAAKYFLLGCLVSVLSVSFHILTSPHIPKIPQELASYYLDTFVRMWDVHRKPVDFTSIGIYLNITGFIIGSSWLIFFKKDCAKNIRLLMRLFIGFSALGIFFGILTHLPSQYVPDIIIALMPQRILNLNILGFLALLVGLWGYYKDEFRIQLGLLILLIIWTLLSLNLLQRYFLFIMMFGGTAALIALRLIKDVKKSPFAEKPLFTAVLQKVITCSLIISILLLITKVYPSSAFKNVKYRIPDHTNYKFFNTVSKEKGILLIPMYKEAYEPIRWTQLLTRRPILLNPDKMDIVAYAPYLGPELEKVLREVYGIELSDPPKTFVDNAEFPVEFNKMAWETRTLQQWRNIRDKFGVTEVLTYIDWKLQLPIKANDSLYILYKIPLEK